MGYLAYTTITGMIYPKINPKNPRLIDAKTTITYIGHFCSVVFQNPQFRFQYF